MKITYVAQYYPPHTGGLEQVAKKQAESARDAGHGVSVVTFRIPGTQAGTCNEAGIEVYRVRGWNILDRLFGLPFCFGGIDMVRTLMREVRNADVVHVHDVFYMSSWIAYLCARFYSKRLILTQHVAMVAHPSTFVTGVERVVYAVWGARMFRYAYRIIVYNTIVRDFILTFPVAHEKVCEGYNGITLSAFTRREGEERARMRDMYGLPRDRILVLFVGRMVPKKGYQELFEARSDMYDIVFVGPGVVPNSWRDTPHVHVLGSRTQEELAELYSVADIFCAPSRGELFTLVMQEACASGLPIVTTDEPAYGSYEIDRSLLALTQPTSDALQHTLTRLAHNAPLCARMGAYSRDLAVQWFDWKKNVQTVLDMYTHLHTRRVQVTTSWDDGHVLDVALAETLTRYGVKGTFYVAPHNQEFTNAERLSVKACASIARTHEVGAHTVTHRHLTTLTDADAREEIVSSKRILEAGIGTEVRSFCYPAGKYHARHARMVRDAGFTSARTVRRFVTCLDSVSPWERPTTIHTYDHWLDVWNVLLLARFNPFVFSRLYRRWDAQAIALFDRVYVEGGVFHLWGHSWEIAHHGDQDRLERVLHHIGGRSDVAYVTNGDVS